MTGKLLLTAALAMTLAACAPVPERLQSPLLDTEVPLAGLPTKADGSWPDVEWWRGYGDPQLDRLMRQAVSGSTTLDVARHRVAEAEQAVQLVATGSGPKLGGSAQVSRQRMSEHGLIPARFLGFTWYSQTDLGVRLDYSFDWWGRHRASVAAAIGEARAAQAGASTAAIALQAAVAQTYFAWQADQARLHVLAEALAAQEQLQGIARARGQAGVDPSDVQLQVQASLTEMQQEQDQLRGMAAIHHASLAALTGVSPEDLGTLDVRPLPTAATRLPANASIDLIARRPDIAASRWQVEAALRNTDVARADFLPDISLAAMAGLSSIELDKLFTASSRSLALSPALHLPIFEGGLLQARHGLSRARLDSAVAAYRDQLNEAAHEVATRSLTVRQLAQQTAHQQQQLQTARELQHQSERRQQQGLTDLAPVLQARLAWLQQRDAALVLQVQALAADIDLIHALGGGYQFLSTDSPVPPADQDSTS